MKTLLVTFLIILSGCSGIYHAKKSKKHAKKALDKGIVVVKDTLIVNNFDTIVETFTENDTTYILKTVKETVTLEPTVEVKTRWQTKIEYKERIKIVKEETKQAKQKTKQQRKRRSQWYLLFIGLGLGFVLNLYIKKLFV